MGEAGWTLEIEGCTPIRNPSDAQIERGLRRLRSASRSELAILESPDGSHVQVGGGGAGCLLEWRESSARRHYRAYQDDPVVPFEDGTVIVFAGNEIPLKRNEWFTIPQAISVFVAFASSRTFPPFVRWRDITSVLYPERE